MGNREVYGAESKSLLLGIFQPPKPAPGGPVTVFPGAEKLLTAGRILFSGLGGGKAPSRRLFDSAPSSAVQRGKSVRRSAQDDDFVGVLKKTPQ
jgi:hypothetical protein